MMIKEVISDVDGTLVDSNDAHASAWQEAFREVEISLKWEEIRCEIGKGADQLLPRFLTLEQLSPFGTRIHNYDALAANKIGLATIAVLTGGFSEEPLREAGAAEIYPDLPSLLKNYELSLLGKNSRS